MEPSLIDQHWYVLYTRHRYEKKIAVELSGAGYETYLPLVKSIHQWSDRKKKIEIPLFNSYVFIHCRLPELKKILFPSGVITVVSFKGEPAAVPNDQISGLKLLLETGEPFEVSNEAFHPGDLVEVIRGPLKGLKGTFNDYSSRKQVMLTIDALQLSLLVTIDPKNIRKMGVR